MELSIRKLENNGKNRVCQVCNSSFVTVKFEIIIFYNVRLVIERNLWVHRYQNGKRHLLKSQHN